MISHFVSDPFFAATLIFEMQFWHSGFIRNQLRRYFTMKRASLNFIIDSLAFAAFVFLTATGILVHYVLPAGTGRFAEIWGLDRHEWGTIHYWFAIAMLAFMAFHLLLHWKWIVSVVKGRPHEGSGAKLFLGVISLVSLIALAIAPFFGEIEKTDTRPSKMQESTLSSGKNYVIDGTTTLQETEKATGVPISVILKELKLPANISKTENFGNIKKKYNINIQDVRNIIDKNAKIIKK
jgi:hypothetical protein